MRALEGHVATVVAERDKERERAEALYRQVGELQSAIAADRERLTWVRNAEKSLRETFESLASRTSVLPPTHLTEQNKEHLQGVVAPLNTELRKLDRHVRSLEEKREGAYQSVIEQVRMISEQYRNLQTATTSLDQALRAPNVRGRWGDGAVAAAGRDGGFDRTRRFSRTANDPGTRCVYRRRHRPRSTRLGGASTVGRDHPR